MYTQNKYLISYQIKTTKKTNKPKKKEPTQYNQPQNKQPPPTQTHTLTHTKVIKLIRIKVVCAFVFSQIPMVLAIIPYVYVYVSINTCPFCVVKYMHRHHRFCKYVFSKVTYGVYSGCSSLRYLMLCQT